MSFVKAFYHIVINTRHRAANLRVAASDEIYAYLAGIIRNYKSKPIAINGTSNHIHLLIDLDASISLSELMRNIKQFSSRWLHDHPEVSKFDAWGKEYFATTISHRDIPSVKKYIDSQRVHHGLVTFEEEMHRIVDGYGGGWMKWMDES